MDEKKVNMKVMRLIKKIIDKEIKNNISGKQFCIGILHQPKRPKNSVSIK